MNSTNTKKYLTAVIVLFLNVSAIAERQLYFHPILPGSFMMGNYWDVPVAVTITKAFEMAETEVTQYQYSYVNVLMGKTDPSKINPSYFNDGPESKTVNIGGIDIKMRPNNPVEAVSYSDVFYWVRGLNNLSTSGNDQIQAELRKVFPTHKKGHVYDSPTEAQWAFVMQNRGKNNDIHFDKPDDSELNQYAWYSETATRQTYPVASKSPRKIDGGDGTIADFYDLEGNVWEWNKDNYSSELKGGIDPISKTGDQYVIRGGAWGTRFSAWVRTDFRYYYVREHGYFQIGLRLVRTGP